MIVRTHLLLVWDQNGSQQMLSKRTLFPLVATLFDIDFLFYLGITFGIILIRSALARRPGRTLRMYTLLRMLPPCLVSALSRYQHPQNSTPRDPPPTTWGPPPIHPPRPHPRNPTAACASQSGRLLQEDRSSKWMVILMAIPMGPTVRWGSGLQRLQAPRLEGFCGCRAFKFYNQEGPRRVGS